MLISRETDYALRLLRAMADRERHRAADLCQTENITQQFGYKILKKLARAGFIESVRGVGGGFRLTADLKTISLYDLLAVLENSCAVSACMRPGFACQWRAGHGRCHLHQQLSVLQCQLEDQLKALSIHSLCLPMCDPQAGQRSNPE